MSFDPTFKPFRCVGTDMEDELKSKLRARGNELVEKHGEDVIEGVISDVEAMKVDSSDETAEILRVLTGKDAE